MSVFLAQICFGSLTFGSITSPDLSITSQTGIIAPGNLCCFGFGTSDTRTINDIELVLHGFRVLLVGTLFAVFVACTPIAEEPRPPSESASSHRTSSQLTRSPLAVSTRHYQCPTPMENPPASWFALVLQVRVSANAPCTKFCTSMLLFECYRSLLLIFLPPPRHIMTMFIPIFGNLIHPFSLLAPSARLLPQIVLCC